MRGNLVVLKTLHSSNILLFSMKKILFTFLTLLFVSGAAWSQNNVGINTSTPDASAALEINSTSQGLLIPRMTAGQRENIDSPASGLLVWQTDNVAGFYYNAGTAMTPQWIQLGAVGPQGPQGETGPKGEAGDNGQGVPTGGTEGQVLAKTDGTDFNTGWITPTGGGAALSLSHSLDLEDFVMPAVNTSKALGTIAAVGAGTYLADIKIMVNANIGSTICSVENSGTLLASYVLSGSTNAPHNRNFMFLIQLDAQADLKFNITIGTAYSSPLSEASMIRLVKLF